MDSGSIIIIYFNEFIEDKNFEKNEYDYRN